MQKFILSLLWIVICVINRIINVARKLYCRVKYKQLNSVHLAEVDTVQFKLFEEHLKSLVKLPRHLAIVIGEELISLSDLANIVVWCLFVGIPYVTLYDVEGIAKKKWKELYKRILAAQKENLGYSDPSAITLHIRNQHSSSNGHTSLNGCHDRHNVHLNLTSYEDGKLLLVKTAQKFCLAVQQKELKPEEIKPSVIDSEVTVKPHWPAPEALLRFGDVHSVHGFMPWHLRLTEIIYYPSHHHLLLSEFLEILRKFNNCEQRCGK